MNSKFTSHYLDFSSGIASLYQNCGISTHISETKELRDKTKLQLHFVFILFYFFFIVETGFHTKELNFTS